LILFRWCIIGLSGLLFFKTPEVDSVDTYLSKTITRNLQSVYSGKEIKFDVTLKWIPRRLKQVDPSKIDTVTFTGNGIHRGYEMATVQYRKEDRTEEAKVQVLIEVQERLPVTRYRLEGEQPVSSRDLVMQWVNTTKMHGPFIRDFSGLEGKVTSHIVQNGVPLSMHDIKRKPLIESGHTVEMIFKNEGVKIVINSIARQSGAKGELIRLYSRETRKVYLAKVLGPNRAQWEKTL